MFKPLLRTIPTLTGNFTLACKLDKYAKSSVINYTCGVTEAVLMPLQNNLANKHINVSLLYDSYEYNVPSFYKSFSSIFYNDNYYFDENNIYDLDLSSNKIYDSRNKDYEFGCKRNIMNSGYQYMFFAPFYVNDAKTLPDYFVIHIEFDNKIYKNIHVKIFEKSTTTAVSNYLNVYLKRYIEKIDERCIFCLPESNQATYFGIDVENGGFKNCKDNVFGILYNKQFPLNDFDRTINEGFSRNKMIIRQIIPLSFMFNITDILTKNEYQIYINKKVNISGWYERDGIKYDFYDFDTDYKYFTINDDSINIMSPTDENISNNRNLQYSLFEALDKNLKYDNTLSITHNRWCLLPTLNNDEKYITNSSNVFTDKAGNYYNTPIVYQTNSSYLIYDRHERDVNIEEHYNAIEDHNIDNIITQTHFSQAYILNENNWYDVYNNKCIVGGLLYDLNNLSYTTTIDSQTNIYGKYQKIDKFNIFAYINILDANDDIKYCKYSFNTDNPMLLNATAYNQYAYNMFLKNIITYNYKYNKYHDVNTIFKSGYYTYNDLKDLPVSYADTYNDIYIDYSDHYYLSNLYRKLKNEETIDENIPIYGGFEIHNEIDPASFKQAVISYDSNNLTQDIKTVKLADICYININLSDNVKTLSNINDDDNAKINEKTSRIAFYNRFIDEHLRTNCTNKCKLNNIKNNINSYYHYIPRHDDSAFISNGHMEKNNIYDSYIYCDAWILNEYINNINSLVDDDNLKLDINDNTYIYKAYTAFINYDHFYKYKERMYGNDVKLYHILTNAYISLLQNRYMSEISLKHEFIEIERDNAYIMSYIDNHELFSYNKVAKISINNYNKIIQLYNTYYDEDINKCVSLILYTDDTDIINKFKISEIAVINNKMYDDKNIILFPLTTEILWSKKSIKETYDILTSKNIKCNDNYSYITHKIYDLESCNKINIFGNGKNNIADGGSEYSDSKFYKLIKKNVVDFDNKLNIQEKNGTVYAFYYITLNLYNNIYSINLDTNNNLDTFDLNKLSLRELLPYLKINLLNYIINTVAPGTLLKKNTVNILIDKTFNKNTNTVDKTSESKLYIDRYYNDITPVLNKKSTVKLYNLLYTKPNNPAVNNKRYDAVYLCGNNISIDDDYSTNNSALIPYIDYDGEIYYAKEYERKFYNNNELYILMPRFEITDKNLYTIEKVREIQNKNYIFYNIFIPHIQKFIKTGNIIDNDEYLFLFNRYRVEFRSYPVKLNTVETKKLYKIKFIFILL